MGTELLVSSAMALLYPAAKRAAGQIAGGFLADASDNAHETAGKFLKWLKDRWAGSPKGRRAIEDVETDPDDAITRQTLKGRLAEAVETDPVFRRALQQQVEVSGPAIRVFISIEEMENVTGLKVGTFESGSADVRITGDRGKSITGVEIGTLGTRSTER
jgi:hypothetical protein